MLISIEFSSIVREFLIVRELKAKGIVQENCLLLTSTFTRISTYVSHMSCLSIVPVVINLFFANSCFEDALSVNNDFMHARIMLVYSYIYT